MQTFRNAVRYWTDIAYDFEKRFIEIGRANDGFIFGPVPRGYKRAICLISMAGPKIKTRVPGALVDFTKDEFKVLQKRIEGGVPSVIAAPMIKGKWNDSKAYEVTETIHEFIFERRKYSGKQSFDSVRSRR